MFQRRYSGIAAGIHKVERHIALSFRAERMASEAVMEMALRMNQIYSETTEDNMTLSCT
jgi:hypothetical protein